MGDESAYPWLLLSILPCSSFLAGCAWSGQNEETALTLSDTPSVLLVIQSMDAHNC